MLTRRDFAGIASCALCAVTGFIATDASAQGTAPATTPGVTRKILSQTDGPTPGGHQPADRTVTAASSYFDAESLDNSAMASCTVVMNWAGKMMVEFFSTEISAMVCRVRS